MLNGRPIRDVLIPFSLIPLRAEQCHALIQAALEPSTRCVSNGDCTGLSCDLDTLSTTENDAVFVVSKCVDPVVVTVTVNHGSPSVHSLVHSDRVFLGGGQYLVVDMARNATDLNFTVSHHLWT